MSKILHSVTVRGKHKTWVIDTYVEREYAEEWRQDGVEIYETLNRIPKWYVDMGGNVSWWCFWQDVFHFKNPWSKS